MQLFIIVIFINCYINVLMAKPCANCGQLRSVVEEQKSKIQLLESRLKDLLRAYKLVTKEKNDLMGINASITADVDSTQQKRLSDLEESVVHMSSICGKFELERKHDKEKITLLENEVDQLKKQLETDSQIFQVSPDDQIKNNRPNDCRNKSSQTESLGGNVPKEIKPNSMDKSTQTTVDEQFESQPDSKLLILKSKHETAIVAPIQRFSHSESEIDDLSDDELIEAADRIRLIDDHGPSSNSTSAVANSGASLFYVNELARKELELAESRLRVREYECSMRELQWKYNNEKYRLQSRIADLELLNNNFMASKSDRPVQTSTVNVAYIRNVLTKLLETKDKEQKQIMINALLTALNSI